MMASTSSSITLEGTLSKWTNVMKGWQYRFFVLDENAGLLSYYTSKEKMMKGVRRGCVRLKDAVIGIDDQEDITFTITVDHKTFHFQAQHAEEREKWVRRLEDTIRRHANRSRYWDSQSTFYVGGFNKESANRRGNYLELLARRISEADGYLQLMIEQINKVEQRIEALEDPEDREKCKTIKESANEMLNNMKHSIVSLQIAKNMMHPINGIYNGPANPSIISDDSSSAALPSISPSLKDSGKVSFNFSDELSAPQNVTTAPMATMAVPETSYSSSEGEEDFYDANDSPFSSYASSPLANANRGFAVDGSPSSDSQDEQPMRPMVGGGNGGIVAASIGAGGNGLSKLAATPNEKNNDSSIPALSETAIHSKIVKKPLNANEIDYDALYEEEEEENISMEAHGSIISHLLSQVKIGMDLTKVVLPTFILERRSLLEMYADYFAHPDLFLRIADLEDPKERIVQVVRWYLSAYHAGRKSSVAKKPYNPILGEVFQCHWTLPGESSESKVIDEGPVPWCRSDQLTFLAEQVSHHPPISAFYAEHYNKKISFTAHVWTKSKFLGLSIGVHNIGEGIVTLVDRSEEYIVTFPNGYGRAILAVPWIELGGSVSIKCPQTGYNATIEFLTKPFYGGKRNRIAAEIFSPDEKKPFVSITGEWTGLMEAKWHDRNKTEVFVDVNSIPIFKKQVRPIVEQEEYESRRVWKEVTAGLKFNDIDRATNAKQMVEQAQRDAVKERKEKNLKWEQKYFKPVGDNWIYTKPLSQRQYLEERNKPR